MYNEENLKRKSINELKEIAKLRRIKNRGKLKKEGFIISILKSESSNAEHNYMKHSLWNIDANVNNDNTNVSNNNNDVNNNTNDDDDGRRDKISDISTIIGRLGI